MSYEEIIRKLKSMANAANAAAMARFGINPWNTLGIPVKDLRVLARAVGKDHDLARRLWDSEIHEARILATIIDVPGQVSVEQMEAWAHDFDSWDVCDLCCMNLFRKTSHAYLKTREWSARGEEFVKRAGFVLMATLAVHDKQTADGIFQGFLPVIKREATDERHFVRKAVNWALRQIGKRNLNLNAFAIRTAETIAKVESKSARWIASDALKELRSKAVQEKLQSRR